MCNGSTADSDSVCEGSNPSSAARPRNESSGVFCCAQKFSITQPNSKRDLNPHNSHSSGCRAALASGELDDIRFAERRHAVRILLPLPDPGTKVPGFLLCYFLNPSEFLLRKNPAPLKRGACKVQCSVSAFPFKGATRKQKARWAVCSQSGEQAVSCDPGRGAPKGGWVFGIVQI